MKNKILVIGGAGYISSHMAKTLFELDYEVVDNLSAGFHNSVMGALLVQMDIADTGALKTLMHIHQPNAVLHFASFIQVGESVTAPAKYYANNVTATLSLLDAMVFSGVKHFIFSSTAAVYGAPTYVPIDEAHPKVPINPYGRSK